MLEADIQACYTVPVSQSNTMPEGAQGSATRPDVSVIIVSWNVAALLRQCLDALLSPEVKEDLEVEIIVVDNASSDNSVEVAQRFTSDKVTLITNKTNIGYGRANNMGLVVASGAWLLILNPDTVPLSGSLKHLLCFAERHPRAGIVSPRLLNEDGTIQEAAFRFPTLMMALLDLFPLPKLLPGRLRRGILRSRLNGRYPGNESARQPYRIHHSLGACMLINRAAYGEVGGFDERIFMYAEEIDLALRYRREGWEAWQVPAAKVIHLGGQSTRQVPARMQFELWRARLYLYRKHYSLPAQFGFRFLLAIRQVVSLALAFWVSLTKQGDQDRARKTRKLASRLLKLALGR